jgi:hypothetical protein
MHMLHTDLMQRCICTTPTAEIEHMHDHQNHDDAMPVMSILQPPTLVQHYLTTALVQHSKQQGSHCTQ